VAQAAVGVSGVMERMLVDEATAALRAELAVALDRAERAERDLDAWVRCVDDPRAASALHYDGCPYEPYAAMPSHDEPEDAPACTCPERHKGAYWKARLMLEMAQWRREREEETGKLEESRRELVRLTSMRDRLAIERAHLRAALEQIRGLTDDPESPWPVLIDVHEIAEAALGAPTATP
jgi:hypothetical protein